MSLIEATVEGTIQPDGTLVLDGKATMPPGRVRVVLQREADVALPLDDPFWHRMRTMWAIPVSRSADEEPSAATLAEVHAIREEWDDRQEAVERAQAAGATAP